MRQVGTGVVCRTRKCTIVRDGIYPGLGRRQRNGRHGRDQVTAVLVVSLYGHFVHRVAIRGDDIGRRDLRRIAG